MTPFQLREAVRALRRGGLIAYPTEAVYGLGCDPRNADAVRRLLELKQRPMDKGLILVAADFAQLQPYLLPLADTLARQVSASWPGPVTWLLPVPSQVPVWLRGRHDSLAVRVSAHPVVRALCAAFGGPIVSTSANPAGQRPARDPLTVQRMFAGHVDCILHAPLGGLERPTEIRDGRTGRIVRAGQ
ncbi:L-threonylcarbamoyladenylate synthase [Sulfurivermis fontis]|jgi:L-threonylcarbamoyladenylate synthase|uniref:L-threonylcarbamoyladenylate synthase n=1 Tax=Sulfurivermis fontis TaxID=1972068 RepID=UPI000FD6F646|nr:L-threonylcarbamoyladenylate synthase [Sulfurivermis fontis]